MLAQRLKELRLKTGESLQEVADAIGASKAYVWTLESGKKDANPTVELLKKLADHFRVSVAYLIGETSGETTPDQLLRMFRNLGELSDRDRDLIEGMIRDMRRRSPEE